MRGSCSAARLRCVGADARRIAAPKMSGMKPKNSQKLPRTESSKAVNQLFVFSAPSVSFVAGSNRPAWTRRRTSRMSYRRRQTSDFALADRRSKTERLAAVSSIRFVGQIPGEDRHSRPKEALSAAAKGQGENSAQLQVAYGRGIEAFSAFCWRHGLERKHPKAGEGWEWHWLFPSRQLIVHRRDTLRPGTRQTRGVIARFRGGNRVSMTGAKTSPAR